MLTAICWVWLFAILGGFFLAILGTPEMERRPLGIALFGTCLLAAIFLVTR